jgi:hypothetical protein
MYTGSLLTQGQITIYDLEDVDKIEKYNWYAHWNPTNGSYYAQANIKHNDRRTTIQMARIVLGLDFGDKRQADHISHNTLDNRKENLRVVTVSQNSQNRLGVKGYYWDKCANKWHTRIKINGKLTSVGYFDVESDAYEAYIEAREKHKFIQVLA